MRIYKLLSITILLITLLAKICYAENIQSELLGNAIISNKNFITETNENCNFPSYDNEKDNQCEVIKLDLYYGKLVEERFVNQQPIYLTKNKEYNYLLLKDNIQENLLEIQLIIKNNNEVTDSLKIYSEKVSETAAISQYYYIDNQLKNIWIVQILADELNRRISYWKHYIIDDTKYIKLMESISCKYEMGEVTTGKCNRDE